MPMIALRCMVYLWLFTIIARRATQVFGAHYNASCNLSCRYKKNTISFSIFRAFSFIPASFVWLPYNVSCFLYFCTIYIFWANCYPVPRSWIRRRIYERNPEVLFIDCHEGTWVLSCEMAGSILPKSKGWFFVNYYKIRQSKLTSPVGHEIL